MLGLAPLAKAALADDGGRKAQIRAAASGALVLAGAAMGQSQARGHSARHLGCDSAQSGSVACAGGARREFVISAFSVAFIATRASSAQALALLGKTTARMRGQGTVAVFVDIDGLGHCLALSAASTAGAVGITREALGAATTVAAGDSGLEVTGLAAGSTLSPISVQLVATLPLVGNVSTETAAVSAAQAVLRFDGDAACQSSVLGAAQAGGFVAGAAIAAAKTQAELGLGFELSGAAAASPTVQLLASGALDFAGVASGKTQAEATGAQAPALSGFVRGLVAASGSGASQNEFTLESAGQTFAPSRAGSAVLLAGHADSSAQLQGAASCILPLSGSGLGLLSVNMQAAGNHEVAGRGASFGQVAGGASGSFMVARDLAADIAIVSDAARAIPLQGQAAGKIASTALAGPAAILLSGTAIAMMPAYAHLASGFDLSGQAEAELQVRSDATFVIATGLIASASAPQQAKTVGSVGLSGVARVLTGGSGAALGLMSLGGAAKGKLSLEITAHATITVARSAVGVADVDAMSGRSLPFAVAARAGTALAVAVSAPLSVSGKGRAALTAHAAVNRAIDLAGAARTDAGVAAAGQSGFDLSGAAYAQASIGAEGRGAIARAATAVAETEIAGGSARSLHVAGSATGHIPLTAEAIGGRVNLKLSAALRVDARAGATGNVAFDAALRGQAVSSGAATGYVALTRAGAGDVAISSHSARVILFPGRASLAIASAGAANTLFAISPILLGCTTIGAGLEQNASVANGQGAAIVKSSGSARPGAWLMAGRSAAFRAPPALQRSEPPRTGLSGRLLSSNSGRILRG
jgi:hypothetical protein